MQLLVDQGVLVTDAAASSPLAAGASLPTAIPPNCLSPPAISASSPAASAPIPAAILVSAPSEIATSAYATLRLAHDINGSSSAGTEGICFIGSTRHATAGVEAHDVGDCIVFFSLCPTSATEVDLGVFHTNIGDLGKNPLDSMLADDSELTDLLHQLSDKPNAVVRLIEGPNTRGDEGTAALLTEIDQRIRAKVPQADYRRLAPQVGGDELMDVMLTVKGEIVYHLHAAE